MSLSSEILNGTIEGVKKLLTQGAPVNIRDEYGYTPLIHAAVTQKFPIVKLLLENNANVNATDISGSSALLWAIDNNDFEMSQLLLQHGANPNAFNGIGQPALFYPLLRNNKRLSDLLIKQGAKMDYAHDFIISKLVGHRFELQGNTDVVNAEGLFISIDLEGFYLEFTLNLIRESLERFINSFIAHRMDIHEEELRKIIGAFVNASRLREFKHFNKVLNKVAANKGTILSLLDVDLLLLPVSYQAHAINYIRYGNFLAKCDRGVEKMTAPIVIYKMGNPKKLNDDFLIDLLYKNHNAKFIKYDLHQILKLEPYDKLPIKHQITGNCSWANTESAVPTLLYILLHKKCRTKDKIEALVPEIMNFYNTWLEWDKDRALEDCLIDFESISFPRQKARAALLGAVLFQACKPNKAHDIVRAKKILKILSRKEFHYIVRIYANVLIRGKAKRNVYGSNFKLILEKCGFNLNYFTY